MKRIHPPAIRIAIAALVVGACIAGCRNPTAGVANPFLAPDRVPPPSTRTLMPGQAQPYYPGDPLPVMQSSAPPQVDAAGLAWSAPGTAAASAAPRLTAAENLDTLATPSNQPSVAQTVAIPSDNESLRFAMPSSPEPAPFVPEAASQIQVAAAAPHVATPPASPPHATAAPAEKPASYLESPVASAPPAPVQSPWRTPQITPELPPPPPLFYAGPQPGQAVVAMQSALPPAPMDVRMRTVSPPPLDASASPSPRVRFPNNYTAASSDGFRPRSSMR